jgi:predicted RND superfamily exporter protein
MSLLAYIISIYTLRHKSHYHHHPIVFPMSSLVWYDHFVVHLSYECMELLVIHRIHVVYTLVILIGSCITYAYINHTNNNNNKKELEQRKKLRQQYQRQVDQLQQTNKVRLMKRSITTDLTLNELRESLGESVLENGGLKQRITELEESQEVHEKTIKELQEALEISIKETEKAQYLYRCCLTSNETRRRR